MAKNGVVTGSGSASALIAAVLPPAVITHTLGSLAQEVLRNKAQNGILLIDTGDGKLALHEYSSAKQTAAHAMVNVTDDGVMVFEPEDATKASSLYNLKLGAGGGTNTVTVSAAAEQNEVNTFVQANTEFADLVNLVKPERPSYNGSSLINAIADIAKEKGKQALIIVDQQAGKTFARLYNDVSGTHNVSTKTLDGTGPEAVFTVTYEAADTQTSTSIYGI